MRGLFCFSCVGVLDREGPTRNSACLAYTEQGAGFFESLKFKRYASEPKP